MSKTFCKKLSQLTKLRETIRGQKRSSELHNQSAEKRACPVSTRVTAEMDTEGDHTELLMNPIADGDSSTSITVSSLNYSGMLI